MQLPAYIGLILLFPFTRISAQQKDSVPPEAPQTEISYLHSAIVGDDYKIFVALPANYTASHAGYPILYVTDANSNFAATAQLTKSMTKNKELLPMIVVGIGYRTDSLAKMLRLRE